jgi:hypothetical protein
LKPLALLALKSPSVFPIPGGLNYAIDVVFWNPTKDFKGFSVSGVEFCGVASPSVGEIDEALFSADLFADGYDFFATCPDSRA